MELNDYAKNSLMDSLLQKSLWETFPSTTTELSFLQCCLPTSCKLIPHMWSNQYLALKQVQSLSSYATTVSLVEPNASVNPPVKESG
jgi:hypothetical protein